MQYGDWVFHLPEATTDVPVPGLGINTEKLVQNPPWQHAGVPQLSTRNFQNRLQICPKTCQPIKPIHHQNQRPTFNRGRHALELSKQTIRQPVTRQSLPQIIAGHDHDAELLKEIAARSTTALTHFYQRYSNIVMAFAMSHLANAQDCREIVNDVFLTAWSSAGSFAGRSSVRTWILGITHHKAMDYLRKRHRINRINEEYLQEPVSDGNTLEQTITALDTASMIRECLHKLSTAHREVIHLAFFEDLSCSEIAEVQGCPVGTVKTRLMHAKEKLKRVMQDAGWIE